MELAAYLRLSELAFTFAPALLLLDVAKLVGATGTGIVLASHSPVAGWITGWMAGWVDGWVGLRASSPRPISSVANSKGRVAAASLVCDPDTGQSGDGNGGIFLALVGGSGAVV